MNKWQKATAAMTAFSLLGGVVSYAAVQPATKVNAAAKVPSGKTILVWSWWGKPELTKMEALANKWAALHHDKVKFVDQSNNPNDKFQVFATAARTGKGPDIAFGMPHDNLGTFAKENLLAPVPAGFLKKSNYTQPELDAVTIKGVESAVPVSVETTAIFYNTKLVKTAPKTWSQFVADANAHGFQYDQTNLYYSYALIGGLGGYIFKDNKGTLNPTQLGLGNAGAMEAYSLMHDMDAKYHWMTPSTNYDTAKAQFLAGKLGMFVSGPWDVAAIDQSGVKYNITAWPKLGNGKAATPFMGVQTAFVSNKSAQANRAADWSLIQYLTTATAQTQYWQASKRIPSLVSLQKSKMITSNSLFKAFADQAKVAVPMPNIPEMQAVWTAAPSVLTSVVNGKLNPSQAAQTMVSSIQKGIMIQDQ